MAVAAAVKSIGEMLIFKWGEEDHNDVAVEFVLGHGLEVLGASSIFRLWPNDDDGYNDFFGKS